jgi:D-alanine-D-alanine ligase-like ATP-grasp enzyme
MTPFLLSSIVQLRERLFPRLQTRILPRTTRMIMDAALELDVAVQLEPDFGYAGQLHFPSGAVRTFVGSEFDVNAAGASQVAKDKSHAVHFLGSAGMRVPEGRAFLRDEWARTTGSANNEDSALRYAEQLGYPVFIKPNSGSQGAGVTQAFSAREAAASIRSIVRAHRVFRVERPCVGRDLRVVVFDGVVRIAYERRPLVVIGNGTSTVRILIDQRIEVLRASGRDVLLRSSDIRVRRRLRVDGWRLSRVPEDGERVSVIDVANCALGATPLDMTDVLSSELAMLACRATAVLGLRWAGVDLLVDGDPACATDAVILEVNHAPRLTHYAAHDPQQEARVRSCLRDVLRAMA